MSNNSAIQKTLLNKSRRGLYQAFSKRKNLRNNSNSGFIDKAKGFITSDRGIQAATGAGILGAGTVLGSTMFGGSSESGDEALVTAIEAYKSGDISKEEFLAALDKEYDAAQAKAEGIKKMVQQLMSEQTQVDKMVARNGGKLPNAIDLLSGKLK